MTYAEQLDAWFEKEKREKGLVDVRFYITPGPDATVESLCKEILEAIAYPKFPLTKI